MKKIFNLIILIVVTNSSFSQDKTDLTGIWQGEIVDRTINNNLKYSALLELQKTGENQYLGFLKLERKLPLLFKVQGKLGDPRMPKENFIGTFLVRGTSTSNGFNLYNIKTLSNNNSKITWCEINPSFSEISGDKMKGKYQGCGFAFGTHVILQGGDITLKKEATTISNETNKLISSYNEAEFEYGEFYISSENNTEEFEALKSDQLNLVRLEITNKSSIDKSISANYEFTLPTSKNTNKTFSYEGIYPLTLKPNEKNYLGFKYKFPFNVYSDTVNVLITIRDLTTKSEISQITGSIPIEKFFTNPIVDNSFEHSNFINDYLTLKNNKKTKDFIENQIKNKDSLAYAWKGILLATGRGGYDKNDEEGFLINLWTIKKYSQVAKKGNAEIAYLVGMAKILSGDNDQIYEGQAILNACADSNYIVAKLDNLTLKLQLVDENEKQSAISELINLYQKGYKRAAHILGDYYSSGKSTNPNKEKAIEWYQKVGVESGVEYYEGMAKYFIDFKQTDSDITTAEDNLKKAALLGKYNAYNYVGSKLISLDKSNDLYVNKGLYFLKLAADNGNREAMYNLASLLVNETYLEKNRSDVITAFEYFKMAANMGHAKAMIQLANIYYNGLAGEMSDIKYRYWLTKAGNLGEKIDINGKLINSFSLNNIFSNLDFSPRREIVVTNQYGTEVERYTEGPTGFELGLDAVFDTYAKSRMQKQEFINGIEFIKTKNNQNIYGGTVSSIAETNLYVKRGDVLDFTVQGLMNFGMMAGNRTPDGIPEGLAQTGLFEDIRKSINDFRNYNIESDYPHGVFMIKIGESAWFNIGSSGRVKAPFDGKITIAVNDIDFTNNSGYYDFEVIVKKGN